MFGWNASSSISKILSYLISIMNRVRFEQKQRRCLRIGSKHQVILGVRLDGVEFRMLSPKDNVSLIAAFREEEVKEAVWQCESKRSRT